MDSTPNTDDKLTSLLGLIERYGEPIRVGHIPETSRLTPDEEKELAEKFLEALQAMRSDAYGLLPAGPKP